MNIISGRGRWAALENGELWGTVNIFLEFTIFKILLYLEYNKISKLFTVSHSS